MKKIVNYIVATLLLVSGYTTVNAQYNEGGGGFIFAPTTTPTRPVNQPKKPSGEDDDFEFRLVLPKAIYHSKLSIPDFPSDRVGYKNINSRKVDCSDNPFSTSICNDDDPRFEIECDGCNKGGFGGSLDGDDIMKIFEPNIVKLRTRGRDRLVEWLQKHANINLIDTRVDVFGEPLIEGGGKKPDLVRAFSEFANFRSNAIQKQLERDVIWQATQRMDKARERFFELSDEVVGLSQQSSKFKDISLEKKNLYKEYRKQCIVINGIQRGYNKGDWLSKLIGQQGAHFFEKSSKRLFFRTNGHAKDQLKRIEDATSKSLRDYFFNSTPANRDAMARDAEKFGRTSVSENEHPDYGMLKLEADMRENKDIINWIASNKQSMVNYLEINNNSKGASHCMRYLFKTWSNKEDFVTPTEFYKSVTRAGFQTSSKPNLALSTRPSQQAIDIGYLGFSNVLHSFFDGRNDAFANQFKGYIINDMFKVNGLPSSIQFEFLGAIFDFGITNGRTNDVVFVGNNGRTLLNNGFNTTEVIKEIGKGNDFGSLSTSDDKFTKFALEELKSGSEIDLNNDIVYDSSILNSNAYCVIRKILNIENGFYKKLLDDFRLGTDNVNLKFQAIEMKGINSGREAFTDPNEIDSKNYIYIYIDENLIHSNNLVEIASTILHEIIHAQISKFVHQEGNGLPITERVFSKANREKIIDNYLEMGGVDAQHNFMADNLLNTMASALRKLDGNRLTLKHYIAYAWEGLENDGTFGITREQEEEFIKLRKEVEQTSTLKCDN